MFEGINDINPRIIEDVWVEIFKKYELREEKENENI